MPRYYRYFTRGFRAALAVVASVVALFFLVGFVLYLPPVQRWAVREACVWAERETGYRVTIGEVRLDFPLDLVLGQTTARDTEGDTLLRCQSLKLSIPLRPLFHKRVDVDGFSLKGAHLDTKSLISDTHIEGYVDRAQVQTHGYSWADNRLDRIVAHVRGADLLVVLTDTATKDTTPSAPWLFDVREARVSQSRVKVILPGDTLSLEAAITDAQAHGGQFDTGAERYSLRNLTLQASCLRYAGLSAPALSFRLDSLAYADEQLTAAARLRTAHSHLRAGVTLPLAALQQGAVEQFDLWANGDLHADDVRSMAASILPAEYLKLIPAEPTSLDFALNGSMDKVHLRRLSMSNPSLLDVNLLGWISKPLEPNRVGTIQLDVISKRGINTVVQHFAGTGVRIPDATQLRGSVSFRGTDNYSADLTLHAAGGKAALRGRVDLRHLSYQLAAATSHLPLRAFLPDQPLTPLTARCTLEGHGDDLRCSSTRARLEASVSRLNYDVYPLDNTRLTLDLREGKAAVAFDMHNAMLSGNGHIRADLDRIINFDAHNEHPSYRAEVDACVDAFMPHAVGLMRDTLTIGAAFAAELELSHDLLHLKSKGGVEDICFISRDTLVRARNLGYDVAMSPDTTMVALHSGDMDMAFNSSVKLPALMQHGQNFVDELLRELRGHEIDQRLLASLLPTAQLSLRAGQQNPLAALLKMQGYTMTNLDMRLETSPTTGLAGWTRLGRLGLGALDIDTLYCDILQDEDGVKLMAQMRNYRKQNPHHFTATIDGYALSTGAGADLVFHDEEGQTGIDLGVQANYEDEGVRVHLYPRTPIIAYRRFTVNEDNYLFLGNDSTISANLDLLADDGTGLKLYGQPSEEGNIDLTLSVNRLNLGELSTVMPWMPPLRGYLSGDCHMTKLDEVMSAMLSIETQQFAYDNVEIGRLGTEITYLPKANGEHYAEAYLSYEGCEIMQASGSYFNRGAGSFVGDVHLEGLPLSLADAFTTSLNVNLTGQAEGDFHAEGPLDRPVMNGSIIFGDAHICSAVYGVDLRMDERPVEIRNSRLEFSDYVLRTAGNSPFTINGYVDASEIADTRIDLRLNTRGFELINAPRTRASQVYGKVYTDFDGSIRGSLSTLKVRGSLGVLDRTNVTYILRDAPVSVGDEFADLVSFMDFRDSTTVVVPQVVGTDIDVNVGINISDAAHFHCLLAEDGHSYVDVTGGGNLSFAYTRQGDMKLNGRYTIQAGEMKYELPVIPLKTFQLAQGSYVEFVGDILNPTLNIKATERMKAAVSEEGQRHTAQFVVGVDITQTLNDMGLEFTVEAPEDMGVQNELASMTALQRNKTAVALMATGMYMTDDFSSLTSGFSGSNALNMFLQSSIQSIAGNALGTVDLNFDIDNSSSALGTTTDYNFAFAKRFLGNRISLIIGGKVSSGADASNTAASIIDNISVEYRLDKGATRYVRLFYDRSAQDALEGRLMETGAGLVLRRKTNRLGELFLFRR